MRDFDAKVRTNFGDIKIHQSRVFDKEAFKMMCVIGFLVRI